LKLFNGFSSNLSPHQDVKVSARPLPKISLALWMPRANPLPVFATTSQIWTSSSLLNQQFGDMKCFGFQTFKLDEIILSDQSCLHTTLRKRHGTFIARLGLAGNKASGFRRPAGKLIAKHSCPVNQE